MSKLQRLAADFRSDTVTRPSAAMRRAMAAAPVGDDVFGDDPTILALEARCCKLLRKPAALFISSGSMGNLIAATVLTRKGEEMIVGAQSHFALWEGASAAQIAGINKHPIAENDDGGLDPDAIELAIQPDDPHCARTSLVCWEITHNPKGGAIPDWKTVLAGIKVARKHGLKTHLDGARLFNAVVETGISAAEYAAPFDSVTFCLSKGLAAPIGSLLAGSKEFIGSARRLRKMLGGGWRQAGILAAAGLYALDHNIARLKMDHKLARELAHRLCRLPGITLAQASVPTNIVYLDYQDPLSRPARSNEWLVHELRKRGIGVEEVCNAIRVVTHADVGPRHLNLLEKATRAILTK
ncbi:MAG TPA: GntG family PLP-dependent aldolase [Planctomycetota bacterium]|jgi:threonine aldolase|nr:GntG family PLP-dependent aldolase [Planctomycetota bacterium]